MLILLRHWPTVPCRVAILNTAKLILWLVSLWLDSYDKRSYPSVPA